MQLAGKRILIFVVAYNAEKTISSVLNRIPAELRNENVEVLVIDDFSQDSTFAKGLTHEFATGDLRVKMLRTPKNQGYGGNQKLGYRYAIDHGFDFVALLHGDGQYAPEKLPDLLEPLVQGNAGAVFGSRMINKRDALSGGMPLYKWIGNQVLTLFQNWMLGSRLSEFHSGYRLYSTDALRQIPFERNSNNFHFDTEIIIQLVLKQLRIVELPIPTFYGDEICHVNGLQYAWQIFRTMCRAQLHGKNLLYDRKFDVGPVEQTYDLKLGYSSSHTFAVDSTKPGARVLDVGCGRGLVAYELAGRAAHVTGIDQYAPSESQRSNVEFREWDLEWPELPVDLCQFDQVFMLDVIEHLKNPEEFMELLRRSAGNKEPEIILTTANIAFFITRLMLSLGHFNYGRKGILDRTHTRLFTFNSLRELLEQAGYELLEMRGIPAPYPNVFGLGFVGRSLVALNKLLIKVSRGFFSYQIFVKMKARPTVGALLESTIASSNALKSRARPLISEFSSR